MIDPHGRAVTYLRVSVTDRCDFRCVYCMAENMTFLPKRDLLTLEELDRLCTVFVGKGVRKLRITGGEPLVRKNIMWFFRALSRHLKSGALEELTLTTNASQLTRFAGDLADCGVRRINISLDTLDPARFKEVTRWGDLDKVMAGMQAAEKAGLQIIAARMMHLSREQAEGFYAVHKERPFFNDLVAFMTSGPIVLQVLEGDNAVARNREVMGATNPAEAAAGTIRAEFAENIEANSVHGSDSAENAAIEIGQCFSEDELVG